ncbi:PPK2 family polyphosphate kinase [Corynebacterium yonathiae]|uniref:PPK2 family polyphosphate--nucleotide phosphotransferase n=1 Tax=Corynebacterium yonathiae TaxID=2913504 RepID=A0A9X3LW75_9CORY|nr:MULTISPECIES: PPK2 family polyphosphate kinase [Corynebacterium]MCZ9295112.1 PPK2 family polyphosphate--nucleotide phosphotransferase [Corynebacterium yonathiae]MDK2582631.1 PPK2 family polyphosphate--nucleotide phosphotransferase [Corynebacterium sp. BWA136]
MGKFKINDALSLRAGKNFRLADVDPTSTPGFNGSKSDLADRFAHYDEELYDLQERLFANGRAHEEGAPSLLVVLQGMDTSGKGGAIRNVFSVFDPQGTKTVGFGKPTEEELEHEFLWRIRKHDPVPGQVVAFDRSHYEDVLIQRVHKWVDEDEVDRRFAAIRDYEQELAGQNTKILKIFLHISPQFQKENLLERTEREDKYWKYDQSDIEERGYWDQYMAAYEDAIRRTDEIWAPWYVIPTDNKKYARMALKFLIVDALRHLELSWPAPDFDPEGERQRILDAE